MYIYHHFIVLIFFFNSYKQKIYSLNFFFYYPIITFHSDIYIPTYLDYNILQCI